MSFPIKTVSEPQPLLYGSLASVQMRTSSFAILWLLFRAEWYKITRRRWPLVALMLFLFMLSGIVLGVNLRNALEVSQRAPDTFHQPLLCKYAPYDYKGCLQRELNATELAEMRQVQKKLVEILAQPLHIPGVLQVAAVLIGFAGLIVLILITALLFGDDFDNGVVRLLLTRGATRSQVVCAKLMVILCLVVSIVIFMITLTTLIGVASMVFLLADFEGKPLVFSSTWLGSVLLYLLIIALPLLAYALISATAAIIGKSTAAGIAGGIGWWIVTAIIVQIDRFVGNTPQGGFAHFLSNSTIDKNSSILIQYQEHLLFGSTVPQTPALKSLVIIGGYILITLCLSWGFYTYRDVDS